MAKYFWILPALVLPIAILLVFAGMVPALGPLSVLAIGWVSAPVAFLQAAGFPKATPFRGFDYSGSVWMLLNVSLAYFLLGLLLDIFGALGRRIFKLRAKRPPKSAEAWVAASRPPAAPPTPPTEGAGN